MGRGSQRWSGSASAGLIAVQVVGESSNSAAPPTMEIECPGGAVIRLREDVSAEVLQREFDDNYSSASCCLSRESYQWKRCGRWEVPEGMLSRAPLD